MNKTVKSTRVLRYFLLSYCLLFFGGCTQRKVGILTPPQEGFELTQKGVSVKVKPLRDFECAYFFDSRLVSRGLQPIQLYIQNKSSEIYVLDAQKITVPLVGRRGIGSRMYRNLFARSIVWLAGMAFYWKIFPLMFMDLILSSQMNKEAKRDIESICIQPKDKLVIQPQSTLHKILFVPVSKYHHHVSITLQEQGETKSLVYNF